MRAYRLLTEADAGAILRIQGMEDLLKLLSTSKCSNCRKGRTVKGLYPSILIRLESDKNIALRVKRSLGVPDNGTLEFRSPRGHMVKV